MDDAPSLTPLKDQLENALDADHLLLASDGQKKSLCDFYGLMSKPTIGYQSELQCPQPGDQDAHTDEDPDYLKEYVTQFPQIKDWPFSILVALQDGTRLRVRSVATKRWEVVTLRAGQILIFRGDVAHHGMGVANLNHRVHAMGIPQTYKGPRGAIYEADKA